MPPDTFKVQNLAKYPEFFLLKEELLKLCDKMDNISDIQIDNVSRVTIAEEIVGRRWASEQVKDFLMRLGMIEKADLKGRIQTYE